MRDDANHLTQASARSRMLRFVPVPAGSGQAGPTRPWGPDPIRGLLDHVGLPWLLPRAEVERRYGVTRHPAYGTKVVAISTNPPIVAGLLWPLCAQVFDRFSPHLPITRFSGNASFGRDAQENLRLTAEQLAPRLGPAPAPAPAEVRGNVVRCQWNTGAARIMLLAWPRCLNEGPSSNQAHERDPRLVEACHVQVFTGFRPVPTDAELGWLDGFVALGRTGDEPVPSLDQVWTEPAEESELEFVREPAGDMRRTLGQFGHSADRRALIACRSQLYVVPAAQIARFVVERARPAKGRGGSCLAVLCTASDGAGPTKRFTVARRAGPDDLNETAAQVAAVFARPLEFGAYHDDE